MENYFQNNISAIVTINPLVADKINNALENISIEVVQSKTGKPIPIIKKEKTITVHSRFDPEKEADRLIEEFDCAHYDCIIVSGFGFGYHIEKILQKIKHDATLLVLERFAWMIKAAMCNRDLQSIFNDKRLILLINPSDDDIAVTMKGRSSYKTLFITHRGSFQIDPEGYTNLQRIAKAYLSTKEVNIATLAKFEKLWTSNIAKNIKTIIAHPPASAFFNKFTTIPAIIVNAGPTLTESIPFIKENCTNALIIAVDTTYKVLEYYNIQPHFCITVDPQLINARYFEGVHKSKTILIADPMVHPSTFLLYSGRKAITGVAFEMMQWIETIIGDYGKLRYGGSVSTNAYDFAKRLGANPIVMVGQDLAFTRGLAHVKGAYLDEHVYLRTNRFYTVEMFNRLQLTALPKIFVKGIKSKQVHTNQKMMIFISWFSRLHDSALINATHDGAYIDAVVHKDADDISLSGSNGNIQDIIDTVYTEMMPSSTIISHRSLQMIEQLNQMLSQATVMDTMLQHALRYSDDLINNIKMKNTKAITSLINKLNDIDKSISNLTITKNIVGLTIQHVIHTVMEGYEIDETIKDEQEAIALRSKYLYTGLRDGLQFSKRIIENMIMLLSQ